MTKNIKIIAETEDYLVINKPAGLAVHRDAFCQEDTLADWLLKSYPELKEVGEPLVLADGQTFAKPGLVHRLDKETSGVMIVAKNQATFIFLKEQFKNHQAQKTYRAILEGELKMGDGETGVIDLPIGRSKKDPRRRVASKKAFGPLREAVTRYKLVGNFKGFSYIEAYPETGRTHQLRAHFKALNHPIVCDKLYSETPLCPVPLCRQALHALRLEVNVPEGGKKIFEAPLPEDMSKALENLGAPC